MYACVCVLKSHRRKIQSNLPCLAPVDTLLCLWNPLFLFPHPLFPLSFYAASLCSLWPSKLSSFESSVPKPCGQDEFKFWPDSEKQKNQKSSCFVSSWKQPTFSHQLFTVIWSWLSPTLHIHQITTFCSLGNDSCSTACQSKYQTGRSHGSNNPFRQHHTQCYRSCDWQFAATPPWWPMSTHRVTDDDWSRSYL